MTIFSNLLRQDRERRGLTFEHVARRLGVPLAAYRALEAGERWPDWTTYDRIATAYGWPRTFVEAGPSDEDADLRERLAALGAAALGELRRILEEPAHRSDALAALTAHRPP